MQVQNLFNGEQKRQKSKQNTRKNNQTGTDVHNRGRERSRQTKKKLARVPSNGLGEELCTETLTNISFWPGGAQTFATVPSY